FQIREGLRAFLLQEWEDDPETGRDRTSFGLEGRMSERTRASHRWFVEPSGDGRAIRSATAVETVVPVRAGHRLNLLASRVWTVSGDDVADGTVLGAGYEVRGGRSLFTGRYEIRLGEADRRHLVSASGSLRMGEAWTLFVSERWFVTEPDSPELDTSRRVEGRVGVAWRPLGSRWQGLVRVDHTDGWGSVRSTSGIVPGVPSEPSGERVGTVRPLPPGIGSAPGRVATAFDRASWTLSLATGARVTARQRLAVTWVGRRVAADPADGIDSALTELTSLHWSARLAERWTLGASARRFAQDASDAATFGYGGEVGFRAIEDVWVVTGWNASAVRDGAFRDLTTTVDGAFVSVRFRFDEGSLSELLR
ncbi:MAG: hypothetical protein VKI81_11810, partial [Synechococcaceae cyanobacterium]|nr:hypothetical protein [Synechococcaceae cyanobacterium]